MERPDYLGGFRRRWPIVVAAIAVGAVAGWFVEPPVEPSAPPRYEAGTAVLGSSNPGVTNLSTLSALAGLGEVPRRVARVLEYEGDPVDLAAQITTTADQNTGILWITATATNPERAELLADTFARQLVKWVARGRTQASLAEAERLRTQIDQTARRITQLQSQIPSASAADTFLLTAERDAMIRRYGLLVEQHDQLASAPTFDAIYVLQQARAGVVTAEEGEAVLASMTPTTRSIVGGAIGLLAGLVLALLLERFDRRIRTRAAAERSFGLPVLAEIPPLPRRKRRRAIVADDGRVSPGVEPFRLLGAVLAQAGPSNHPSGGNGHESHPAQTILVTSPGPAEGKSRVAGSLAAALAESGKRVLLMSCDFRHPRIHRLFEVSNERGLSDALGSGNGRELLEPVAKSTGLPNLVVVPSGSPAGNPGALLSSERMEQALEEARDAADVVLLDAPALLAEGDAVNLLDEVDSVLVVARVGKTTEEEAQRTAEILERLDVPVAGVALNESGG